MLLPASEINYIITDIVYTYFHSNGINPSFNHKYVVCRCTLSFLVISVKIQLFDLTRLPSKPKAQMASGQGSQWLIEIPTILHQCVTQLLKYLSLLFLSIFTLLIFIQSVYICFIYLLSSLRTLVLSDF